MNSYEKIKEFAISKTFPIIGRNQDNEVTIIEQGKTDFGRFFKITTVQQNDWCRIKTYWENGTIEETYKK